MISTNQIIRLLDARDHKLLVSRILTNGRCRSGAARQVLTQSSAARVAAIGLGLQRMSELCYGPSDTGNRLAQLLLDAQDAGGTFADHCDQEQPVAVGPRLAATAVAARALISWSGQPADWSAGADSSVNHGIDRALDALAAAYEESRHNIAQDGAAWAIVLWQLGDVSRFRARFPVESLVSALMDVGEDVDDELCRYALAVAA